MRTRNRGLCFLLSLSMTLAEWGSAEEKGNNGNTSGVLLCVTVVVTTHPEIASAHRHAQSFT